MTRVSPLNGSSTSPSERRKRKAVDQTTKTVGLVMQNHLDRPVGVHPVAVVVEEGEGVGQRIEHRHRVVGECTRMMDILLVFHKVKVAT